MSHFSFFITIFFAWNPNTSQIGHRWNWLCLLPQLVISSHNNTKSLNACFLPHFIECWHFVTAPLHKIPFWCQQHVPAEFVYWQCEAVFDGSYERPDKVAQDGCASCLDVDLNPQDCNGGSIWNQSQTPNSFLVAFLPKTTRNDWSRSRSDACVEGNDGVVTLLCLRAATVVGFKPVKKR